MEIYHIISYIIYIVYDNIVPIPIIYLSIYIYIICINMYIITVYIVLLLATSFFDGLDFGLDQHLHALRTTLVVAISHQLRSIVVPSHGHWSFRNLLGHMLSHVAMVPQPKPLAKKVCQTFFWFRRYHILFLSNWANLRAILMTFRRAGHLISFSGLTITNFGQVRTWRGQNP